MGPRTRSNARAPVVLAAKRRRLLFSAENSRFRPAFRGFSDTAQYTRRGASECASSHPISARTPDLGGFFEDDAVAALARVTFRPRALATSSQLLGGTFALGGRVVFCRAGGTFAPGGRVPTRSKSPYHSHPPWLATGILGSQGSVTARERISRLSVTHRRRADQRHQGRPKPAAGPPRTRITVAAPPLGTRAAAPSLAAHACPTPRTAAPRRAAHAAPARPAQFYRCMAAIRARKATVVSCALQTAPLSPRDPGGTQTQAAEEPARMARK